MTQTHHDRIRRLLKLANITQEFEHINLRLCDQWCELREELGLSKLLLLIQEYAQTQPTNVEIKTSDTGYPHQNAPTVQ